MGKRWAVPHTEKSAACGTESRSVPVRNGPASHKLPLAHNRNPTFPAVGFSAVPSLAGVLQTLKAPPAAAVSRTSTSCPVCREAGVK